MSWRLAAVVGEDFCCCLASAVAVGWKRCCALLCLRRFSCLRNKLRTTKLRQIPLLFLLLEISLLSACLFERLRSLPILLLHPYTRLLSVFTQLTERGSFSVCVQRWWCWCCSSERLVTRWMVNGGGGPDFVSTSPLELVVIFFLTLILFWQGQIRRSFTTVFQKISCH